VSAKRETTDKTAETAETTKNHLHTKKQKNKKKFIDFQKIERKRKHYTAVVNPVQL